MRIRARRNDDGVLGPGVHHDDRGAAGSRHDDRAVQADVVGAEVGSQLARCRVVAEGGDELDRGAGP